MEEHCSGTKYRAELLNDRVYRIAITSSEVFKEHYSARNFNYRLFFSQLAFSCQEKPLSQMQTE